MFGDVAAFGVRRACWGVMNVRIHEVVHGRLGAEVAAVELTGCTSGRGPGPALGLTAAAADAVAVAGAGKRGHRVGEGS